MKKNVVNFCLVLCSLNLHFSLAAGAEEVEVKEVAPRPLVKPKDEIFESPTSEVIPRSQHKQSQWSEGEKNFESTSHLRSLRRVGIGAMTSGATGLLGLVLELNLMPSDSLLMGYGGGPQYEAFNFQWKHLFGDFQFAPYAGIGYARWYNASGEKSLNKTQPSVLGSKFLSDSEKESGRFSVDLLSPAVGLQYHVLQGSYAGVGLFGEIVFLTELSELSPAPSGAFGAFYYF